MSSFMSPPRKVYVLVRSMSSPLVRSMSSPLTLCPPAFAPSPHIWGRQISPCLNGPAKTLLCLFISQLQIPDLISIPFHFNSVVIQEFQFISRINFPEAITILIRNSWNGCTNATSRSTSAITSKTILNIKIRESK